MEIDYGNKEIRSKLFDMFGIRKPVIKLLFITMEDEYGKEQFDRLDKYINNIFRIIGFKQDIEFTKYEESCVYGNLKNSDIYFKMTIDSHYGQRLILTNGNYEYTYFLGHGNGIVNGVSFENMYPNLTDKKYKDENQKIWWEKYSWKHPNKYEIDINKEDYNLNCIFYDSYKISENEQSLDEYFINYDTNSSVFEVLENVLKIASLDTKELEHIHVHIQRYHYDQLIAQQYIAINNDKIVSLGEDRNGIGYDARNGKLTFKNGLEDPYTYDVKFEGENAILKLGKEEFIIPLSILKQTDFVKNAAIESASQRISSAIGMQLKLNNKER